MGLYDGDDDERVRQSEKKTEQERLNDMLDFRMKKRQYDKSLARQQFVNHLHRLKHPVNAPFNRDVRCVHESQGWTFDGCRI
jgi:hypothetical protein